MKKAQSEYTNLLDGPQRNTYGGHLVFQNETKDTPSQACVMMNITYHANLRTQPLIRFTLEGYVNWKISKHYFMTDKETPMMAILFFKMT